MTHYYDAKQEGPLVPFLIPARLKDLRLELYSAAGVFSKNQLDAGTALLLAKMRLPEQKGARVLDLGCGIGVVGVAAKLRRPDLLLVQSDVSERAIELTRLNAKKYKIESEIVQSDLFTNVKGEFDLILVNPPYVAGRELIFKMIEETAAHLVPGGSLQLVARHNKGGKVLSERMAGLFGNIETIGMAGGYRVYCSKKE